MLLSKALESGGFSIVLVTLQERGCLTTPKRNPQGRLSMKYLATPTVFVCALALCLCTRELQLRILLFNKRSQAQPRQIEKATGPASHYQAWHRTHRRVPMMEQTHQWPSLRPDIMSACGEGTFFCHSVQCSMTCWRMSCHIRAGLELSKSMPLQPRHSSQTSCLQEASTRIHAHAPPRIQYNLQVDVSGCRSNTRESDSTFL